MKIQFACERERQLLARVWLFWFYKELIGKTGRKAARGHTVACRQLDHFHRTGGAKYVPLTYTFRSLNGLRPRAAYNKIKQEPLAVWWQ